MTTNPWPHLKFWDTGEWQVIQERLEDLKVAGIGVNPSPDKMFLALETLPIDKVKVCILGQDPYPNYMDATGLAFSVPKGRRIPPTLKTIFEEYHDDLGYPIPTNGDLTDWVSRGVLLWNAIPTCAEGRSMSHSVWPEWPLLTREIITTLSEETSCVFAGFGTYAGRILTECVKDGHSPPPLITSHPSPRGKSKTNCPFVGSRVFSTLNDKLNRVKLGPIDWRLE